MVIGMTISAKFKFYRIRKFRLMTGCASYSLVFAFKPETCFIMVKIIAHIYRFK